MKVNSVLLRSINVYNIHHKELKTTNTSQWLNKKKTQVFSMTTTKSIKQKTYYTKNLCFTDITEKNSN